MPDDQAVERGARALADEYYGIGWDEASDRHDNLRSEARTVLEAADDGSYHVCAQQIDWWRQKCTEATAERDVLRAQMVPLEAALTELVTLKDGPRDENYRVHKDAAWDRARKLLNGEAP